MYHDAPPVPVGAGLERVVQVLADGRDVGHGGDRVRPPGPWGGGWWRARRMPSTAHRPRRSRRRAYTPDTTSPAGGECRVAAVAVHVLAKQRDLGDAVGAKRRHLGDDLLEQAAHLRSANSWHDAERQLLSQPIWIVTRSVRPLTLAGALGNAGVIVEDRRVEDLGDRTVSRCLAEQLRRPVDVVGPEDDVDMGRPLVHECAVLLPGSSQRP